LLDIGYVKGIAVNVNRHSDIKHPVIFAAYLRQVDAIHLIRYFRAVV
jgi:hypothetical protein